LQSGSQQQQRLLVVPGQQQQKASLSAVDAAVQHLQCLLIMSAHPERQDLRPALPSATRTCGVLAVLGLYSNCQKGLPLPAVSDKGNGSSSSSGGSSGGSNTTAQQGGAARPGSSHTSSSSSSSSGGGGGRSSTSPAAAARTPVRYQGASDEWVWEVSSTNLQHLPDIAPALAKCIGLSKLQLACIAAHMLRSDQPGAAAPTGQLLSCWETVVMSAPRAGGQQQQQQPFNIVQDLGQLELSVLFLKWVAACDSSSQQFARLGYSAAVSAVMTMQDFDRHRHQQQQPTSVELSTGQVPQPPADLQQVGLMSRWAGSTLPVLLRFIAKVLDRTQAEAAAAAAVTGAGAGHATASSSASGDGGCSVLEGLLATLNNSVQLLGMLGMATTVETGRGAAGEVAALVCAPVWNSYALEVMFVLERHTRLLLSLWGTSHSALAQESHFQALCGLHNLCLFSRSGSPAVLLAQHSVQALLAAPSASDGQQQGRHLRRFMSLLVSALKLAGKQAQGAHDGLQLQFCLAEASACARILGDCITRAGSTAGSAATCSRESAGGGGSSSASSSDPAAGYVACLPWLVLLGRYCFSAGSSLSMALQQSGLVALLEFGPSSCSTAFGIVQTLPCCRCSQCRSSSLCCWGCWMQCRQHFHVCQATLLLQWGRTQVLCRLPLISLHSSCVCLGLLPAASRCLTSATTQIV
jgi:hypothetical protein